MDNQKLETFKQILTQEKQEITQNLIQQNDSFSKLKSPNGGDIVDLASNFSEKQLLIGLSTSEKNTLKSIDEALKKIKNGTFGICESCSKPIEEKRLQAIPYANLCIQCKKKKSS